MPRRLRQRLGFTGDGIDAQHLAGGALAALAVDGAVIRMPADGVDEVITGEAADLATSGGQHTEIPVPWMHELVRAVRQASRAPSGDHAGLPTWRRLRPAGYATAPVSTSTTTRCHCSSAFVASLASSRRATRPPSGLHTGSDHRIPGGAAATRRHSAPARSVTQSECPGDSGGRAWISTIVAGAVPAAALSPWEPVMARRPPSGDQAKEPAPAGSCVTTRSSPAASRIQTWAGWPRRKVISSATGDQRGPPPR